MSVRAQIAKWSDRRSWSGSPWGSLALMLSVVSVASMTVEEARPTTYALLAVAVFGFWFAGIAAVASLIRREGESLPATVALLVLLLGTLLVSPHWFLAPFAIMMFLTTPWGVVAAVAFPLLLWFTRATRADLPSPSRLSRTARRWTWIGLIAGLAIVAGFITRQAIIDRVEAKARAERKIRYAATVKRYSDTFPTGMTRDEVEARFRASNTEFRQMCCVGKSHSAYADLIRIGEEDVPWFCSRNYVYLAFEFSGGNAGDVAEARPSDRLVGVTERPQLEGCL